MTLKIDKPTDEYPRLTPDIIQKIGFIPGYHPFDAVECMKLNEYLAQQLAGLQPFSHEWYDKAKTFHREAKSMLRSCG